LAKKKIARSTRFGVYSVLKYKSNYILIKKSKGPFKGRWDLPGGKLDFGETADEALKRELKEETGLKVRSSKLETVVSYTHKTEAEHFHHIGVIYTSEVKDVSKLKRGPDGNDSFGAEVFSKKELRDLKLTPLTKLALKEII